MRIACFLIDTFFFGLFQTHGVIHPQKNRLLLMALDLRDAQSSQSTSGYTFGMNTLGSSVANTLPDSQTIGNDLVGFNASPLLSNNLQNSSFLQQSLVSPQTVFSNQQAFLTPAFDHLQSLFSPLNSLRSSFSSFNTHQPPFFTQTNQRCNGCSLQQAIPLTHLNVLDANHFNRFPPAFILTHRRKKRESSPIFFRKPIHRCKCTRCHNRKASTLSKAGSSIAKKENRESLKSSCSESCHGESSGYTESSTRHYPPNRKTHSRNARSKSFSSKHHRENKSIRTSSDFTGVAEILGESFWN